jgi:hypothetical protein
MTARACPNCGADMSDRRPNAVFCKRACKDEHRHESERADEGRSEAFWAAVGRVPRPGTERAQRRFVDASGGAS